MDNILDEICIEINGLLNLKENVIVGVAGAGCIGKSTFASNLVSILHPFRAKIIPLDAYMLERELAYKIEPNMTGYDIRRNNIKQAVKDISGLVLKDKSFKIKDYDRSTHSKSNTKTIELKQFLIIEGVHALNEKLLPYIDLKIFMEATEEVQFKLRLKREKEEFGYDEEKVKERWKKYWPDYLKHVKPQKSNADIVLEVFEDYSLKRVK